MAESRELFPEFIELGLAVGGAITEKLNSTERVK